MLISKQNRKAIYQYLYQEGVLVTKKDFNMPKHGDIDVPNLQVIKACQSLQSRGFIRTNFSWQYFYYYLTNEGIDYLREFLHLPVEVVPRTLVKSAKPMTRPGQRPDGERREQRGPRDEYRRREGKEGGFGGDKPAFRGAGRGGPRKE